MNADKSPLTPISTATLEYLPKASLQQNTLIQQTEYQSPIYAQPNHESSRFPHVPSVHLPTILACENIIVHAIDELNDYIRRGSSLYSILKYIQATIFHNVPMEKSTTHKVPLLPKKLEKVVALSLKSLVLQGLLSPRPNGSKHQLYPLSKLMKRQRLHSIEWYQSLQTQCRDRLFQTFQVHPLKDRVCYVDPDKARRKLTISKCKLSESKVLTVTPSLLSRNWMDLDQRKKARVRQRSISLVKTELLLKKRIITT